MMKKSMPTKGFREVKIISHIKLLLEIFIWQNARFQGLKIDIGDR